MNTIDFQLNCEGLNCPMPIVELTKTARSLGPGKTIEVTATDLAFKPDLEAWARRMGHSIESYEELDSIQRAVIILKDQS
ncbi:MAG: sulfurtransferase TusA family protein [Pirellulaceae bacterium]|nr:sulfurtransferase TusA family protein [Planctomycetales bacterium]